MTVSIGMSGHVKCTGLGLVEQAVVALRDTRQNLGMSFSLISLLLSLAARSSYQEPRPPTTIASALRSLA
jgi:hypothetical protein